MMSNTVSNEQVIFKKNSPNNLGMDIENDNQVDLTKNSEICNKNSNEMSTKLVRYVEDLKREGKEEKINEEILENPAKPENTLEREAECEVNSNLNETSTCPSKLKNRSGSRNSKDSQSSSNSSYHIRKSKKQYSKRKRSLSHGRRKHNKRSRSRSRKRENSHRRRDKTSRREKEDRDRKIRKRKRSVSSSDSDSSDSESTIKKRNYQQERRKVRQRSRSNSALRVMKMKNLENACGYYQRFYQRPHEDNDPNKPQLYWDGYQWVIRPTTIAETNFDIIKPGRKILIANVPLHLNIQINLFREFLITKITEKNVISKRDVRDINNIITGIEFEQENNTAIVVMESIDIAKRMVLLDGLILLGHTLRFSLYQDIKENEVSSSNITKAQALANSAHLSAKSAAIAFAAFKNLEGKSNSVAVNLDGIDLNKALPSSRIVKVMNLIDPKESVKLKSERFEEILEDIKEEFSKFGHIVSSFLIKSKMEKLGAECGSVFIEFQELKSAEYCMKGMKDKRYEGRDIKIAYINEDVFKKEIL